LIENFLTQRNNFQNDFILFFLKLFHVKIIF
jgi:hypothetical protein